MSTNLPETDEYATNVEINTDGEAFNQAGYWKTVQGVNNRVVNLKNRVVSLEGGNPELMLAFGGKQIYRNSTDPVLGLVKSAVQLYGNQPTYSVPSQYWGGYDTNGVFNGSTGWPDTNVQQSTVAGALVPTPNEWLIDQPNPANVYDWTEAQTQSGFRVYVPISGWYLIECNLNIEYKVFLPSPVGLRQVDLTRSIVFHQTAKNGTNASGQLPLSTQTYKVSGLNAATAGITDPEDLTMSATSTQTTVMYIDGNSTDLTDSYAPSFFVDPNYVDLNTANGATVSDLPSISGSMRITKIPDIQNVP